MEAEGPKEGKQIKFAPGFQKGSDPCRSERALTVPSAMENGRLSC